MSSAMLLPMLSLVFAKAKGNNFIIAKETLESNLSTVHVRTGTIERK